MNNIVELVFIIDKSGSMAGLESDTIGGFNATIKRHKKDKKNKAYVTTILFNTNFDMIHDRVELSEIKQMTESDYEVGGSTALLDAVGETIEHIKSIHKYARPEDVPGKTLFVIKQEAYLDLTPLLALNLYYKTLRGFRLTMAYHIICRSFALVPTLCIYLLKGKIHR